MSNPYKFKVYRSAAFTIGTSATTVVFDTKTYDTGTNFSTTTGLFTAPAAGFYFFTSTIAINQNNIVYWNGNFIKNGSGTGMLQFSSGVIAIQSNPSLTLTDSLQLATGDTIGISSICGAAANGNFGAGITSFSGFLVSAT